jgi:N utilization substance protein B
VLNEIELAKEYIDKTPNWDSERIAEIDTIILKMAICEFLKFPSIPVKVTINEYLELAKEYSTPKSSIFINGILDNLVKDFTNEGKMKKSGRGLL